MESDVFTFFERELFYILQRLLFEHIYVVSISSIAICV